MKSLLACLLVVGLVVTVVECQYKRSSTKHQFIKSPYGNFRDAMGTPICLKGKWGWSSLTACPLTCENYPKGDKACTYNLVSGCKCNDGFILRDKKSFECVKPGDCKKPPTPGLE